MFPFPRNVIFFSDMKIKNEFKMMCIFFHDMGFFFFDFKEDDGIKLVQEKI